MTTHESVLCNTATRFLVTRKDGCYLDCTGGLGGHSAAILAELESAGRLWICDYHRESVTKLKQRFANDNRVTVLASRFSQIFDNLNFSFSGILADLGISSDQLADPHLGIGFQSNNAALDMRLDSSLNLTAADILKTWPEKKLADLFFQFGGERASRKIAAAIAFDRAANTFYTTTSDLRDLCARVLGRFYRKSRIHPATKVFQALRIAVNQELAELEQLLEKAPPKLETGGRCVIIAFHEGEDRLVKNRFRSLAQTPDYSQPVTKATKPDADEISSNPRARSARLRVLEKN